MAAPAAIGPRTRLPSDSAHRMVKGAPNGRPPVTAALEAETPKIRTGIDKRQDQHRHQQAAAAQRHGQRGADQRR